MPTILKTKNSVTTTVVPTTLQQGELAVNITDKKLWVGNAATTPVQLLGAGVTGDVVGPASATDNAIARFDGTTGKLIQNSLVTVSDTGAISAPVDASISGLTVGKGGGAISTNAVFGRVAGSANTTGNANVFIGDAASFLNTTGSTIVSVGKDALYNNTTGGANTALGYQSLFANTTAPNNTAVGFQAGYSNTTGTVITAIGRVALFSNTTGGGLTALGNAALFTNTTGSNNTAIGDNALLSNTTASHNTAVGYQAGYSTTTSTENVFVGAAAGRSVTTGTGRNVAVGYQSSYSLTTGTDNVTIGYLAGYLNTTGNGNVYIGSGLFGANLPAAYNATGSSNTYVGGSAGNLMTTGSKNTILGCYNGNQNGYDLRTANNNIVLSDGDGVPKLLYVASAGTWVAGPSSIASGAGTNALKLNTGNGYITYDTSSARYKDNIRDSVYGLADVLKMRSAQFEYKDTGRSDVGLIAEELEPIIPELVGLNKDGQPDSVSYDRMVSVLVKAIQELKAEVDSLKQQLGK
jgi:hypothetical protein